MSIKKVIKELNKKIGKKSVKTSEEFRVSYSYDATGKRVLPSIVVFPENVEDVKNCLEIAFKYKIPVVPRGAGVGYSGGSVPVEGSISIVFTKMNKIISIDTENMTAEVEPGVITYDLQTACEKKGLFYPPDPASLKTSTIGGNISENAGGPRCFKYGVTSNYVLRIEGYLVNGKRVTFGSASVKDVTGYDIKSVVCGSEGTLMIITKVILRLIPIPADNTLIRFNFKSLEDGAIFIENMLKRNIFPSALEFMDKSSVEAVYEYMKIRTDLNIQAIVLMELDGERADIDSKIKRLESLKDKFDIISMEIADKKEDKGKLWELRRNISPAITKIAPKKINEDISVPRGRIPETVKYINSLSEETGIKIVLFGHFGDGNIHTNILIDPLKSEEVEKSEYILDKMFTYVIGVGGTISGEHGIGLSKKRFLKYQYGDIEISIFKNVKKAFDPEGLLNPGKIF